MKILKLIGPNNYVIKSYQFDAEQDIRVLFVPDIYLPISEISISEIKPKMDPNLANYLEEVEPVPKPKTLTKREQEVLELSTTLTAAEIAKRLGISRRTVEMNKANIIRKFG